MQYSTLTVAQTDTQINKHKNRQTNEGYCLLMAYFCFLVEFLQGIAVIANYDQVLP